MIMHLEQCIFIMYDSAGREKAILNNSKLFKLIFIYTQLELISFLILIKSHTSRKIHAQSITDQTKNGELCKNVELCKLVVEELSFDM